MPQRVVEKKLHVLYEASRVIGEALNLDKALGDMLTILSDKLAMKRATVVLKTQQADTLAIRASIGLTSAEMERGIYRIDEGVTGHIFQSGEPYVIPDISQEPMFLNKTGARDVESGISFIGVPIMNKNATIGVLNVDRLFGQEVSFDEDVEFLSVLAVLIAQLVNLNEQVEQREEGILRANRLLKAEISDKYHDFFMVGTSPAMKEVQELIRKVAASKATVLLLGESGTGKTLIARIIHEMSQRAQFPFIKLNCAALPENLLESELFGYEKGAFTGADRAKAGRIEEAHKGTLFLDEIGELPLLLQTKLLRFLQEREFERLGSNRTRTVDVRIVTATNRVLAEAVEDGTFREDLYYRLNVFPIQVPPLRERTRDVPLLLDHFLNRFSKEYNKKLRLAADALEALTEYAWPGNVREMENLVERLAILSEADRINRTDLPAHILTGGMELAAKPARTVAQGATSTNLGKSEQVMHLEEVEKREVLAALERNDWVQARAAAELGLTVRQLGYRIKKFRLEKQVFDGKQALNK